MARDSKLNFTFTRATGASIPALSVNNLSDTASSTDRSAFIYADAAGGSADFLRGASNAIAVGGFRNTLADASVLVTQAGGSAITNDPAIVGNTSFAELYCRVVFASAGAAVASNTKTFLVVEAASDSGLGTAGTDWQAVSPMIDVSTSGAVRTFTCPTAAASAGVYTTSAAHGLSVGDLVVFTSVGTGSGTIPAAKRPLFVATVPSTTTFTVTATYGGDALTSAIITTGTTAGSAAPAQKRLIGIQISPNARPWLRLAVNILGTGTAAASQGVWIQDATLSVGRDSAATL